MGNFVENFCAAPGVLISVPQLKDPHFERSVVLMFLHTSEGALGFVINHQTPYMASDITTMFGLEWPGKSDAPLLNGGPVNPDGLWMVHDDENIFEDSLTAGEGLVTSNSPEALTRLCVTKASPLWLGIGCAGWGKGQLESEMASGAWINAPASPEMVFEWPREEVWDRSLRSLGIDPALLMASGGLQ